MKLPGDQQAVPESAFHSIGTDNDSRAWSCLSEPARILERPAPRLSAGSDITVSLEQAPAHMSGEEGRKPRSAVPVLADRYVGASVVLGVAGR
jgi:hypothetical protein